ncbi:hypothetical protein EDB81DRAFT_818672 [Dactylonectria macrodidyma]|uniref:Uncharacterized protein n=1 Tax=Dactylonectria macrodidyma TaxID=307937 RepID=A0A9P9DEY1_9HYPO|nr:hypothetical protein EDB81DRAFT_818672 [Dactylonectria macrodidyma]
MCKSRRTPVRALPSPRSRNLLRENVPLSAVKPMKGVMPEPEYCTFQSTDAEIPSTTLIEDDFWGYLNFVPAVDLSLEFPTSASVYSNISTDDGNVNSKPARVEDWMSSDEETLSHLETAVSTTLKRFPAEMKETLRKEISNALPLRNFHPSITASISSAQKNVTEVPEAKCYCQGNWHPRHGEGFTHKIENSDVSTSRILRARNRLLPPLKLNMGSVSGPTTFFLATDEEPIVDLHKEDHSDCPAASYSGLSPRVSFYTHLPEKIKRHYLTKEEQLAVQGLIGLSYGKPAAMDEKLSSFNPNRQPKTRAPFRFGDGISCF